jgi:hypothetical protein
MLSLTGTLINTFRTESGTNKDGEAYDAQNKIQLLGDVANPNGTFKKDMYTLTVKDMSDFEQFKGKEIIVPIGVFSSGRQLTYFVSKGGKPSLFNPI